MQIIKVEAKLTISENNDDYNNWQDTY